MLDWSVIIVNWNTRERLRECLRSVFSSEGTASFEVFVVDNASEDGSAEMILHEYPKVILIENKTNRGFAAANNQAIRRSQGSNILLLNPDCELTPGALENLLIFIKSKPLAGVVGGKLFGKDNELQFSVRRFPTLASQAAILLKLPHLAPNLPSVKRYLAEDYNYRAPGAADQVMGAFFAIPRHVLAEVGLLDENFYIWFEEVDFCKRVRARGYEVLFTPMAEAKHVGGESFGRLLALPKQRIWNRSLSFYLRKHHGVLPWLAIQPFRPISLALSYLHDIYGKITKNRS